MVVPIPRGNWRESVLPLATEVTRELTDSNVRVMLDDREVYTPGWKFSEWEMRGVPLRMEIGPRDIEKSQVVLVRRDTSEKIPTPIDGLVSRVNELLLLIQKSLLEKATRFRDDHTTLVTSREEFVRILDGKRPGFIIAPWCGQEDCEVGIKTQTQATIRNITLDPKSASGPCVQCGRPGKTDAYFAKAY